MDPTVTYREMLDAWAEDRFEDAAEHARDLQRWLDQDGFPPIVDPGRVLGDGLARAMAVAVCR